MASFLESLFAALFKYRPAVFEKGELAYPVSEVTIAGHLTDIFSSLTPADDLEFKYATNAPTVRMEGMTVAGT